MSPTAGLNLVKLPNILFMQQGYAGVFYNPRSIHMNSSDSKTDFLSSFCCFLWKDFQKKIQTATMKNIWITNLS